MTEIEATLESHLRDRALAIGPADLLHQSPLLSKPGLSLRTVGAGFSGLAVAALVAGVLVSRAPETASPRVPAASVEGSFGDASFLNAISGATWQVVEVTDPSGAVYDIDQPPPKANFTIDPGAGRFWAENGIDMSRPYSEDTSGSVDFGPILSTAIGISINQPPAAKAFFGGIGHLIEDVYDARGELTEGNLTVRVDGYVLVCHR